MNANPYRRYTVRTSGCSGAEAAAVRSKSCHKSREGDSAARPWLSLPRGPASVQQSLAHEMAGGTLDPI